MDTQKLIVDKITAVLESTDKNQSAELKKLIDQAGHIFVAGAGRSKLVSSFLAMRLVHCGYNVSMVGEIVTPALKEGDLYIVISGSGGTKTLLPTIETAKSKGAKIAIVSMKASSGLQYQMMLVLLILLHILCDQLQMVYYYYELYLNINK